MSESRFQPFHFSSDDGLKLYGRDYPCPSSSTPPVVCLPGLTRNSRDFHSLAAKLQSEGLRIITLDYRGRGQSEWDPNKANYNIMREAQDVLAALDHLGIEKARFIGTSRGGLILHMLGNMAPDRIISMIFNDIGPVIESDGLRHIRDYLSEKPPYPSLGAAIESLVSIHRAEFPALSDCDWQDMASAIYRQTELGWIVDFDPALAEPLKTIDFSQQLPDLWSQFELLKAIPLLVVRGEHSRLLSEKTVSEMLERHSKSFAAVALGQGHAPLLHLDSIYAAVSRFLK
ncbi:alpha/beta hydrolase [Rhizobium sp. KVB221]|uniref:Alpha/beta hydrolase n=1 Tax=Rhizobium setariae TaxID=2801340 RepID=A0A936YN20_9HYPH|nr:alpha/beta hydrolase [Rhizobium setariae]MBL0371149.1 alpha/beta hydrolase [Rhizobium setariae]